MNVTRLNINVGGNPSSGFDGDEKAYSELTRVIGSALPLSYMELMRQADGGHPEIGCFRLSDAPDDLFDVDWFYSIHADKVDNVLKIYELWNQTLGEKILPLGRDGGGNQVYLDLNILPASVWLYTSGRGGMRRKLTDSLEDFIDRLESNPDFI